MNICRNPGMADIVIESPFGSEWLAGDKINEL